eukprot:3786149-Rhodomonas_salina.2
MVLGLPAFVNDLEKQDKDYLMEAVNNTIPSGSGFSDVQVKAYSLLRQDKISREQYRAIGDWVHERALRTGLRFNPEDRTSPHYETAVWAPHLEEDAVKHQGMSHDERWEKLQKDRETDKKRQNQAAAIERKKNEKAALKRTNGNPKYQVVPDGKGGYKYEKNTTRTAVKWLISQPPTQL